MEQDAFSRCHPAVNFLYFVGAIGFGVVIQHPAYIIAGVLGAGCYYLLLNGRSGWNLILGTLPLFALTALINPLFNTAGAHILFHLFSRPYTLEALYYGMAIAGIFLVMILWFGCYNKVLTSDKFTFLFGSLIPALSLLLVMVLRMIPSFMRKAKQITGARSAIGMGISEEGALREKAKSGMSVLSSLTDWALEGSVVTADSMRSRGYGSARRTSFHTYRMTVRDWCVLGLLLILSAAALFLGDKSAQFTPQVMIPRLSWGFAAYCAYLLIPTVIHMKEAITWHISRSKI